MQGFLPGGSPPPALRVAPPPRDEVWMEFAGGWSIGRNQLSEKIRVRFLARAGWWRRRLREWRGRFLRDGRGRLPEPLNRVGSTARPGHQARAFLWNVPREETSSTSSEQKCARGETRRALQMRRRLPAGGIKTRRCLAGRPTERGQSSWCMSPRKPGGSPRHNHPVQPGCGIFP